MYFLIDDFGALRGALSLWKPVKGLQSADVFRCRYRPLAYRGGSSPSSEERRAFAPRAIAPMRGTGLFANEARVSFFEKGAKVS